MIQTPSLCWKNSVIEGKGNWITRDNLPINNWESTALVVCYNNIHRLYEQKRPRVVWRYTGRSIEVNNYWLFNEESWAGAGGVGRRSPWAGLVGIRQDTVKTSGRHKILAWKGVGHGDPRWTSLPHLCTCPTYFSGPFTEVRKSKPECWASRRICLECHGAWRRPPASLSSAATIKENKKTSAGNLQR